MRRRRAGFTLLEMMVVLVILGLLAAVVGPPLLDRLSGAKEKTARVQIELFSLALDTYRLDNGRYPTSEQGLAALAQSPTIEPRAPNWRGPYLRKAIPLDPWGQPYVYRSPGEVNRSSYDLLSLGRDGRPGGTGEDADVTSWQ